MQFRFGKIIMLFFIAGIVAACNKSAEDTTPVDTTPTPDKLVRDGVQRLWTQETEYYFNGSAKLEFGAEADYSRYNENLSTSSASASQPVTVSQVATINEKNITQQPLNQYHDLLNWLSSTFTLEYTCAVDLNKRKVEILPLFSYEAKNANIYFRFPIQIDIDKLTLYIDSSVITNVSDAVLKQTQPEKVIGDRFLKIVAPQDIIQHLPIDDLIKALPKAMDDGFASFDKKSFATVSVDDYGKQLNAKYQVKFTSNGKENIRMMVAILDSLSKNLEQQGQQAAAKKGLYEQQDYMRLKQFIDLLSNIYKELLDDHKQQNPYTDNIKLMEKIPLFSNYYFDASGRILALQSKLTVIPALLSPFGSSVTLVIDQKFHYSKRSFTINPTKKNTFNINFQCSNCTMRKSAP